MVPNKLTGHCKRKKIDNIAEIVMQQSGVVTNEKPYPFLTRPKSKAICL